MILTMAFAVNIWSKAGKAVANERIVWQVAIAKRHLGWRSSIVEEQCRFVRMASQNTDSFRTLLSYQCSSHLGISFCSNRNNEIWKFVQSKYMHAVVDSIYLGYLYCIHSDTYNFHRYGLESLLTKRSSFAVDHCVALRQNTMSTFESRTLAFYRLGFSVTSAIAPESIVYCCTFYWITVEVSVDDKWLFANSGMRDISPNAVCAGANNKSTHCSFGHCLLKGRTYTNRSSFQADYRTDISSILVKSY